MKKIKLWLAGLCVIAVLGGAFGPMQVSVRADDGGGPQGTSDSKSKKKQETSEEAMIRFLLWLLGLL